MKSTSDTNVALETRFLGVQSMLNDVNITTLEVDASNNQEMFTAFSSVLQGCPYKFIQLAGSPPLQAMIDAMNANGCSFQATLMGSFDTNELVYESLRNGKLQFSVSQHAYLQASVPLLMAALFLTTGGKFPLSTQSLGGEYLSGPILLTKENLPASEALLCTVEAFPVCPNTTAADGSPATCPCTNRRRFTLGGITHATVNAFWDPVYAAMKQAGDDFDVNLQLVRWPNATEDVIYSEMTKKIEEFCSQPVDGLFVTLPNEQVATGLKTCVDKGIPVVVINAGSNYAADMQIPFVGQAEFEAGNEAGQKLIDAGVKKGICLMQIANQTSILQRCAGMEYAFKKAAGQVEYLGAIVMPQDPAGFLQAIETAIGEDGSWAGYGALCCGAAQFPFLLPVIDKHPLLTTGTFDTSPIIYQALSDGQTIFGIDQNAYLQGYWPIPLLVWNLTTNQTLLNSVLASGPQFYTTSPSNSQQACQQILFQSCPVGTVYDVVGSTQTSIFSFGAIFGVVLAVLLVLLIVTYLFCKECTRATAQAK